MEITIYRNQLKLDADIETRKAGFFQIGKENADERNESQMSMEDSDKAYFERQCQQGIQGLMLILHKYVTGYKEGESVTGKDTSDNKRTDTKSWSLTLEMDSKRNIHAKSLAELCHKYVLLHVLHAWSVMTMPGMAQNYMERKVLAEAEIKQMVYRKELPTLQED